MSLSVQTRFVIGGPARCGKTSLSMRIAAADRSCFVLGVDALFRAILRRGIVNHLQPVRTVVRHYLTRLRYQDAARNIAESPLDYSDLGLDALTAPDVLGDRGHPIGAYGRAIDAMATAAGKTSWATFDLHPEFAYAQLRKLIPGLKLAVMFRDPQEAIAAVLYWRRPGEGAAHKRREFRRALLLWGMSAAAALAHRNRWPDDVRVLTLPELLDNGATISLFGISAAKGDDGNIARDTLYFRCTGEGFALPDGREAALLSEREQAEITELLIPLADAVGLKNSGRGKPGRAGLGLRIYLGLLITLARWCPQRAVAVMDFLDNPVGVTRRQISTLREAIGTLLRRNVTADRTTR